MANWTRKLVALFFTLVMLGATVAVVGCKKESQAPETEEAEKAIENAAEDM